MQKQVGLGTQIGGNLLAIVILLLLGFIWKTITTVTTAVNNAGPCGDDVVVVWLEKTVSRHENFEESFDESFDQYLEAAQYYEYQKNLDTPECLEQSNEYLTNYYFYLMKAGEEGNPAIEYGEKAGLEFNKVWRESDRVEKEQGWDDITTAVDNAGPCGDEAAAWLEKTVSRHENFDPESLLQATQYYEYQKNLDTPECLEQLNEYLTNYYFYVLRRGQKFYLAIEFANKADGEYDKYQRELERVGKEQGWGD